MADGREAGKAAVYDCKRVGKTCAYGGRLSGAVVCEYILAEHRRRGCPAEACDRYRRKAGTRGRKPGCTGS